MARETDIARKSKHRRLLTHSLALAGAGVFFTLIFALVQPFYTFNLWFSDQFLDSETPSPNIVIVGVDDASLKAYGKWSEWPRSLHAQAVTNLSEAGSTVIGYDIVFAGASPSDPVFAEALEKAGNVVLAEAGTERVPIVDETVTYREFVFPSDILTAKDPNSGHVNIVPDADGKIRRLPLIAKQADGRTFPSLTLAVLFTLFHKPLPEYYDAGEGKFNLFSRDIPVDSYKSLRLNYTVYEKLPVLSYADVIRGEFDRQTIKNKIVLIGMTSTADVDTWAIPNSSIRVPGVWIHAAAIDTILRTAYLTEASMGYTVLTLLLLTLICVLVLPRFGTWYWTDILKGAGLIIGLLAVYIIAASLSTDHGYILNILYPALILAILFVANLLFIALREQSDKRLVKNLFGRYVSPQVSKQLVTLASSGSLNLGGEDKEVTIFFADIRNFTTLSEKMTPAEVVKMLNTCLPVMIDAIVRNGGLVNKFAGDNLMGVWNAPQAEPEHARLAIKAAWEAQIAMKELALKDPGLTAIQFGIGINTGTALAGNIGSLGRAEYTVIGDAVNLASRICGVAPGGQILIGPETYVHAQKSIEAEPQPPQNFKGKSQPITVYLVKNWKPAS
jgi:adenylate cyclase